MASFADVRAALVDLDDCAGVVMEGVSGRRAALDIERAALAGLAASLEALQQVNFLLESAQRTQQDTEPFIEALAEVEQKLAFFQGCTMRRSSLPRDDSEADDYAAEGEQLAAQARATRAIDRLVEAYKRLEGLEARIVGLRSGMKSGSGPEPRVLDLPRARVLVARRQVGRAVVELDEE